MTPEAEKFIAWRNKRLQSAAMAAQPSRPTRPARPRKGSAPGGKKPRQYPFGDEMLSIPEIADRLGTSKAAVYNRINAGIPLNMPILTRATNEDRKLAGLNCRRIGKRHLFNGEMLSTIEIADRTGLGVNTIYRRIRSGVDLGKADARRKGDQRPFPEFDVELFGIEDPLSQEEIEGLLDLRIANDDFKYS